MSIVFIHNFYFNKINTFVNKSILPNLTNLFPTLYEPSYFYEIENTNPIIIHTNKYTDQNIYIVENNKITNFYKYIININSEQDKILIKHNYNFKKKIFLFF